jgi:hypothetical protein
LLGMATGIFAGALLGTLTDQYLGVRCTTADRCLGPADIVFGLAGMAAGGKIALVIYDFLYKEDSK